MTNKYSCLRPDFPNIRYFKHSNNNRWCSQSFSHKTYETCELDKLSLTFYKHYAEEFVPMFFVILQHPPNKSSSMPKSRFPNNQINTVVDNSLNTKNKDRTSGMCLTNSLQQFSEIMLRIFPHTLLYPPPDKDKIHDDWN